MGLIRWLLLALALLPFAEIAVFIAVATTIGAFQAFVLLGALCLLGVLLMRHFGLAQLSRMRLHAADGGFQTISIAEGSMAPFMAALLLAIPGFITDAVAALIFAALLLRRLGFLGGAILASPSSGATRATRHNDDGIVDLAPDQWHVEPQPRLDNPDDPDRRAGP